MDDEKEIKKNIPIPDPSFLTTQQLYREVTALKEIVRGWVEGVSGTVDTRITGELARFEEKFLSIQVQFKERDVRTEQSAGQVKLAVDAALQAQKEAAGEQAKSFTLATNKSETSMNAQITGLDSKINDVKDRLNRVEGMGLGRNVEHSERAAGNMSMLSVVSLIIGALIGVGGIIVAMNHTPQTPIYIPLSAVSAGVPPAGVPPAGGSIPFSLTPVH